MKDPTTSEDEKWARIKTLDIEEDRCMINYQTTMIAVGNAMAQAGQGVAQATPVHCTSQVIGNYIYTNCR